MAKGKVQLAPGTSTDAGKAVQANDSRLSNSRTPTPHAASHATSGADALTPSDIGAITPDEVSDAISAALDPHTTNTSIHVSDSTKIAAKPTISSGAGKIQALVASSGNRVTLPGTSSELWFYFILHYNSSGTLSLTTPAATGIAAGASLVGTAETGYLYSGFGYRVS